MQESLGEAGHFHSPGDGPGSKWLQKEAQLHAHVCQGIAVIGGAHELCLAKFFQTAVEHRRGYGFAGLLQGAECGRALAQLPDNAHGPPLAQQVKQRHERHAAAGTANRFTWCGYAHSSAALALNNMVPYLQLTLLAGLFSLICCGSIRGGINGL